MRALQNSGCDKFFILKSEHEAAEKHEKQEQAHLCALLFESHALAAVPKIK